MVIEAYRGLDRLELELDETVVLIGENNVGKTSVLEALDACLGQRALRRGSRFDDYDHRRPGTERELPDGHELSITLTFHEAEPDEWNDDVSAALSDVIQLDDQGRRWTVMRVSDVYDAATRTFTPATTFLNLEGRDLRPRGTPERTLRRLAPLFYLPADRDASSGFRAGAPFWAPFLRDPQIPAAVREDIESRLQALNEELIAAAPSLQQVRKRLERVRELVDVAPERTASLEPVPGRIPELLRRTDVRLAAPEGARIPLDRHGGGTQNVAVLALFEAYLDSMLRDDFERDAAPILALEEPEAHLHPGAVRSAWALLEGLPGQRIVATHSGDLLSRAPLRSVRRLARSGGTVGAYQVRRGALTPEAERKVDFHVRRARGELLFARVWLMGEGETEYWVFQSAAEAHGLDLEREGIRVVEYAQAGGPAPLATLADELRIEWHFVIDDDEQGERYASAARDELDGRPEGDHITVLPYRNMEHLLCEEGCGDLYEAVLLPGQRATVTASPGDPDYWEQVAGAVNSKQKTRLAAEVADEIRRGARSVPPTLVGILETVKDLSER